VPHQLATWIRSPRRKALATALCIALLAAILAVVSETTPANAGENAGLCTPNHSRFVIPGDFVLPACFDGSHLVIHNDTDFPLTITMSGATGTPSLQPGGDLAASIVEQYSVNEGDLMPDYRMSVPIGSGTATLTVNGSTTDRTYLLVRALLGVLPIDVVQKLSTAQALAGELTNDWQKYEDCRNSPPGFFGSLGCDAIYYRDVAFALGRAVVQFGASAVVGAILNLLQTAQWADAASGEVRRLFLSGSRTLDLPGLPASGGPTQGASLPPQGSTSQPSATPEQLTATLTENPFLCDGGTREVGYISGAAPGERVTFSSPQLGTLSTGTAGPDGRVPLNWVCQPSDAGGSWQVFGRGANGATVSFTVTGAPGAAPPSSPSGQQVYRHHVYNTCANGKCGLRLHTGPGYSNYPVTRVLVDGDAVGIVCQARGEPVSGIDGSSSDVWDKLIEGDWAADFYIDTSGTTGSFSPPIPIC
jgi:hypothetical protein